MKYDDNSLKSVLGRTRVVACVGASAKPERASHYVSEYLRGHGYRVIPVNPGLAGEQLFGETVVASLADIPAGIDVDLVNIFRRSDAVLSVVEEALAHLPALRTVWMQLGVTHPKAAALADSAGLDVVQDRCTKAEHARLIGRAPESRT